MQAERQGTRSRHNTIRAASQSSECTLRAVGQSQLGAAASLLAAHDQNACRSRTPAARIPPATILASTAEYRQNIFRLRPNRAKKIPMRRATGERSRSPSYWDRAVSERALDPYLKSQ